MSTGAFDYMNEHWLDLFKEYAFTGQSVSSPNDSSRLWASSKAKLIKLTNLICEKRDLMTECTRKDYLSHESQFHSQRTDEFCVELTKWREKMLRHSFWTLFKYILIMFQS